jgi:hypothetical protein
VDAGYSQPLEQLSLASNGHSVLCSLHNIPPREKAAADNHESCVKLGQNGGFGTHVRAEYGALASAVGNSPEGEELGSNIL